MVLDETNLCHQMFDFIMSVHQIIFMYFIRGVNTFSDILRTGNFDGLE